MFSPIGRVGGFTPCRHLWPSSGGEHTVLIHTVHLGLGLFMYINRSIYRFTFRNRQYSFPGDNDFYPRNSHRTINKLKEQLHHFVSTFKPFQTLQIVTHVTFQSREASDCNTCNLPIQRSLTSFVSSVTIPSVVLPLPVFSISLAVHLIHR